MKVSVVIPAYNEEGYIGRCLKAALREIRRSGIDAEVIVVDNASTDETAAVVSAFDCVTLVHEPRRGLSWARQRGYCESGGELIANLDADCVMPRGWLTKAVRAFDANPRLVCLSGPFTYYDLPSFPQIVTTIFFLAGVLFNTISQYVLRTGAVAQGGNFTVRRAALDEVGGYNTDIEFYGEDTDIACRLARVGSVKFSFRYPIRSSGRRLAREGVFRAGYVSAMNNIFVVLYGRPLTRSPSHIRVR
jgi:glycosyltransferase involved in cell wall biosynthesis